ncbi:MAG: hypothetical protein RL459_778 [Pseudomonadota bacterium]|jgi:uncharacterized protein YgbK (DUF1537 family)
MILGVIADDFTGATDVAGMLVRGGMRTVQTIGVPQGTAPDADAVVVALKSRTCPVEEALRDSLAALSWLRHAGAKQFYFKYCSTFDSTPKGNIGPVAEALLADLGADFAIACPAFPENGRTVYNGHLFVGQSLLSESGMRDHPLTPMTDANLVRVLQSQVQGRVGLADHHIVSQGPTPLQEKFQALRQQGHRWAVVDAIDQEDLFTLAAACEDLPLITAGSGVALGLPAVYAKAGLLRLDTSASQLDAVGGGQAVLAGSCSQATRSQVAQWQAQGRPAFWLDPLGLSRGDDLVGQALALWAQHASTQTPVLFYASAEPDAVRAAQKALGVQRSGQIVEEALARIAQGLVQAGARRLVVAGGETSGAVVKALSVVQLRIGPLIVPGVPWTHAHGRPLLLALKSGNFGGPDFFCQALDMTA